MLRLLGIVHDLVDVVRIRSTEEDDVRPPLAKVRGDLDDLVLGFGIGLGPFPLPPDFLVKEPLVAVFLAVQRPALKQVGFLDTFRDHLLHVLMPETTIDVDLVACPLGAGEGSEITAAVGRVDVRNAVFQLQRIIREHRRSFEEDVFRSDMLQLIVRRKKGRRHGLAELLELVGTDEVGLVAVVPVDVGHFTEDIVLMPGRTQVDDPASPVADVLQFVVLQLRAFPLRPGDAVREIADIVRDDIVGVLAGDGRPQADAEELMRAHGRIPDAGGEMIRAFGGDGQILIFQALVQFPERI